MILDFSIDKDGMFFYKDKDSEEENAAWGSVIAFSKWYRIGAIWLGDEHYIGFYNECIMWMDRIILTSTVEV